MNTISDFVLCHTLKEVGFGFENGEYLTVPAEFVKRLWIGSETGSFEDIEDGKPVVGHIIDPFIVEIDKDLDGYINPDDHFYMSGQDGASYYQRLLKPRNITYIDLLYKKGKPEYYATNWTHDEMCSNMLANSENPLQKHSIRENGDILLVVGKDAGVYAGKWEKLENSCI